MCGPWGSHTPTTCDSTRCQPGRSGEPPPSKLSPPLMTLSRPAPRRVEHVRRTRAAPNLFAGTPLALTQTLSAACIPPSLPPSCQHSFFEQCSTRRWQTRHHTTPHGTHTTTHGPLRDSATTAFKPVPSPKTVRQPPACCAAVVLSLSANVIRHRRCPPDPPPVALGAPPPGARVARARVARPELEHVNVFLRPLATAQWASGAGGSTS